ncbi:MAG: PstA family ABC transporter permease [Planctomycetota bacterium]|jgi:phosphate transport system permease protein
MSHSIQRKRNSNHVSAQGEPLIWLTGGMFAIACFMIVGLLGFVLYQGLATLWPRSYLFLGTIDGDLAAGEFWERRSYVLSRQNLDDLAPESRSVAESLLGDRSEANSQQWYLRTGNFEVTNRHFQFVPEVAIASETPCMPSDIWLLERRQWGNLYGFPKRFSWSVGEGVSAIDAVRLVMGDAATTNRQIETAKKQLEHLDRRLANARLAVRQAELAEGCDLQRMTDDVLASTVNLSSADEKLGGLIQPLIESAGPKARRALEYLAREAITVQAEQVHINEELSRLEQEMQSRSLTMQLPVLDPLGAMTATAEIFRSDGKACPDQLHSLLGLEGQPIQYGMDVVEVAENQFMVSLRRGTTPPVYVWIDLDPLKSSAEVRAFREHQVLVSDIVRLIEPNRLTLVGKIGVYATRWWEFLFGQPREAGVEGGVFPAIWGTIVMTLIMSMVVMPFGVLAALYMREYAKGGWLLSAIRISINNLAGVPSIVYGVFGLSFFCYTVGGYIDGGPQKAGFTPWPEATWFAAMATLALIGLVAFVLSFLTGRNTDQGSTRRGLFSTAAGLLWLATLAGIILLLIKTPMFHGFYEARLPNPTFGKGCLLWAACTLALLTLPVVIVATEEALAAVPNSLREGSYACGAGKWQTIERIVLPYARPGIITGFILAMARGAGEVAPMMLVGAIPMTSDLPLDLEFPFLHGSRSFMHLGFQIYALGFQSQNSEAAKPMVFTATLLLLTIVTLLNLTAIWLRARLRKRFQSSQF